MARSLANARQLYWRLHPRLTWIVTITAFAKPSIACPSLRPGATSIFRWLTAGVIPEMPKALRSWLIGYPLHSSAAEPGLVQAPDILAACSIAAEPLVNLLERPGVIASRNKIFCVFHPAKAITQLE